MEPGTCGSSVIMSFITEFLNYLVLLHILSKIPILSLLVQTVKNDSHHYSP